MSKDNLVEHPPHYNQFDIECIDVIDEWELNFCLASALKYIWRVNAKGNPIQDLRKAITYLEMELEKLRTTAPAEITEALGLSNNLRIALSHLYAITSKNSRAEQLRNAIFYLKEETAALEIVRDGGADPRTFSPKDLRGAHRVSANTGDDK